MGIGVGKHIGVWGEKVKMGEEVREEVQESVFGYGGGMGRCKER